MGMKTPLVAFAWLTLGCACALALHEKNAGPAKVELKFRPPAPLPLTPEQQLATFGRFGEATGDYVPYLIRKAERVEEYQQQR